MDEWVVIDKYICLAKSISRCYFWGMHIIGIYIIFITFYLCTYSRGFPSYRFVRVSLLGVEIFIWYDIFYMLEKWIDTY